MRVVSVFGVESTRIGGTETFARELSIQLKQQGWENVICFLNDPPPHVREFLNLPNVSFEVLRNSVDPNWDATKRLARILRIHKPEILHLHFTGFLGVYPWLAKFHSVRKVFFTDQTSRPAGYVPQLAPIWKRGLVRIINLPLTKIMCVSNYGYNCMTSLGLLPNNRYQMIYNSVDLSRVKPHAERAVHFRSRYGIPVDRTIVAQVSWIIPEKGISELLKAAQRVISQDPKVQFVFVGEGPFRAEYQKQAQEMGLAGNVTWTGLVKDPFVEGVFDAADIVCQVSNWEEVFGWVIAEGMAFGKPIVGTRVGAISELIEDGNSGYLVDRGDDAGISEKILALIRNQELRNRMGDRGREIAKEKFDLSNSVSQLLDLYGINNGS